RSPRASTTGRGTERSKWKSATSSRAALPDWRDGGPLHPAVRPTTIHFPPVSPSPELRVRFVSLGILLFASAPIAADRPVVRSAKGGAWESRETWVGGKVPAAG